LPRPSAHECRFHLDSRNAVRGALFDLGADYLAIGATEGQLSADVLDGQDSGEDSRRQRHARQAGGDRLALQGLRDSWSCPTPCCSGPTPSSTNRPARERPTRRAAGAAPARSTEARPLARKMTADLIEYIDTPNAELAARKV